MVKYIDKSRFDGLLKKDLLNKITTKRQKLLKVKKEDENLNDSFEKPPSIIDLESNIEEKINISSEPISIIIAAYKTQDFIEECLDSIENQTYFINNNNYEILLGIDACEETLEKVKEIRHKYRNLYIYFSKKNVGWPIIKNSLTTTSKYTKILFFDSDDIMEKNLVNDVFLFQKEVNAELIRFKYNKNHPPAKGSCFIMKESFERLGGYGDYYCAADREFLIRCEKNNIKIASIDDKVLFKYRKHPNQLTVDKKTSLTSLLRRKIHDGFRNKKEWLPIKKKTTELINIPNKPKICLLYDCFGWAYYNKSISIKKRLDKYYDIDLIQMKSMRNNKNLNKYDIIVCYWAKYYDNLKSLHNDGVLDINRVILGTSGFNNLPTKNIKYGFANNPDLYNMLENDNKYYCPNGVEITLFKGIPRTIKNKNIINVGVVGSLKRKEYKGGIRIIEVVNRLNNLGYNVQDESLIADTPNPNKLLSQIDMVKYYEDIDIFIVSSPAEGTPNPLLEAMSMGIPCVSNPVGFVPLLIEDGETGCLTSSYDDIEGFVEKIKFLIDNPKIYENISINSIERIKEYDWDGMVYNYKHMIDDFLNKTKETNLNLDDYTVVIRSVGERTEQLCYKKMVGMFGEDNVFIVKKIPFVEAIRETYKIGINENKKWTLVIDADVIPDINKIYIFLYENINEDSQTFCIISKIKDKILNRENRIGGIHLYNTKLLNIGYNYIGINENIRPEATILKEMKNGGYGYKVSDINIGIHDYEQYYKDLYRKSYIHAIKHKNKIKIRELKNKINDDDDYKVILLGYEDGLKHRGEISINKNFFNETTLNEVLLKLELTEKLPIIT